MGAIVETPPPGAPSPPVCGIATYVPLMGDLLWDVVRHIPRANAQSLDAWSPDDLKALPRDAYDDLADASPRWRLKANGRRA